MIVYVPELGESPSVVLLVDACCFPVPNKQIIANPSSSAGWGKAFFRLDEEGFFKTILTA